MHLWQSSGKSAGAVEDDLGISRGLLYKWWRKIEASGGEAFPGRGHQSETEAELSQLRQENDILRQERGILKKAVAIIKPPEAAILAVSRAAKVPVVLDDDRIEIRQMASFTLIADHRLVDGAKVAQFLADLKMAIEHPGVLL